MNLNAPINNKYYKWYLSLCISRQQFNRIKKRNDDLTKHHIIPDCFYIERKRNKKIKDGWINGNPDDLSNIVYLTNKEHFIAHWLLCFSYNHLAKKKVCNAFRRMCKGNKNSKYYEHARKLWEDHNRKEFHPNWKGGKIKVVCGICFEEFEAWKCDKRKYCSRDCQNIGVNGRKGETNFNWKGGLTTVVCETCGNQYKIKRNRLKMSRFCSRKCVRRTLKS